MTAGDTDSTVLGRIVRPADYARVLAAPLRLRSEHFAVHHLEGRPLPPKRPGVPASAPPDDAPAVEPGREAKQPPDNASLSTELSTGPYTVGTADVDDLCSAAISAGRPRCWLGLVVPKRHAKRAVTRNLVKRQVRHIAAACADRLPQGLWVVRQRAPFDPKQFPSAASDALRSAARAELLVLFERAMRGERDRVKPRPALPPGEPGAPGAPQKKPGSGKNRVGKADAGGDSKAPARAAADPGNACAH